LWITKQSACEISLHSLSQALTGESGKFGPDDFERLVDNIDRAMFAFESTSNHAVIRIYRKGVMQAEAQGQGPSADLASIASVVSDPDEDTLLSQHQNENLFLVYL
jgi:hypothetical protein